MPVKEIIFQNSAKHNLSGTLKFPDTAEPTTFPLVIVLHKFGDNSDHELITNLANFIYPYGYATLRFDFHGHGRSDGEMAEVHITQKIDDVISAISFAESLDNIDSGTTTLIGHGMGADVAILTATRDERIACLVLLAPRSDLAEHMRMFGKEDLDDLDKKGFCMHYRFGRISKHFITHLKQYDMKEEISKVTCPLLLLHGRNDFAVRWESSRELYFAANEPKRMEIIDDADHWFRDSIHREQVFELTIQWINRHIKQKLTYKSDTTENRSRARLV